jgi:hypothetical protein
MDKKARLLFRGVSEEHNARTKGKLLPWSTSPFTSFVCCGDPHAQCGYGVVCGSSEKNEVLKHQIAAGMPTSGISTTPFFARAVYYATDGGKLDHGYVYVIDRAKLADAGVKEYVVSDFAPFPKAPEDEEVILVAADFGEIPGVVVFAKERVSRGQRERNV